MPLVQVLPSEASGSDDDSNVPFLHPKSRQTLPVDLAAAPGLLDRWENGRESVLYHLNSPFFSLRKIYFLKTSKTIDQSRVLWCQFHESLKVVFIIQFKSRKKVTYILVIRNTWIDQERHVYCSELSLKSMYVTLSAMAITDCHANTSNSKLIGLRCAYTRWSQKVVSQSDLLRKFIRAVFQILFNNLVTYLWPRYKLW